MEFSDSFLVNASIKQVYSTILDPHAISSCLPDLESMEVVDANTFKAKFKVGLSYIRGSVNFEFTLSDKIENKHAKLIGVGTGLSSTINIETSFDLSENEDKTKISWTAQSIVEGLMASIGSKLVNIQTKKQIDQLIAGLQIKLENL